LVVAEALHASATADVSEVLKTIAELVKLCNDNTIKNACWEETDYDPDNPPITILRNPATPEAIAALEKRLDHGLPDDYKEFLSISNGLGSWWNGFFGEPEISSTDTVQIMDATEEQNKWTELGVEFLRIPNPPVNTAFESVIKINNGDSDTEYEDSDISATSNSRCRSMRKNVSSTGMSR